MMVILRRLGETKMPPLFDEAEAETLRREMRDVRDGSLAARVDEALQRYWAFNAGLQEVTQDVFSERDYDAAGVWVGRIDRDTFGAILHGVVLKRSGETAVYSRGVGDGPSITTYYRSDARFGDRQMLSVRRRS